MVSYDQLLFFNLKSESYRETKNSSMAHIVTMRNKELVYGTYCNNGI